MTKNIAGAYVCSMRIEFNLRHNVQYLSFSNVTKNIAGAYVCSMRIEFNLRHNVQYLSFSNVLVWTGSDRCVLDDNENA